MAGNVSIVNVGITEEEKKNLLRASGLNEATIRHCLAGRSYAEEGPRRVISLPGKSVATIVSRPATSAYGSRTPIAGPRKIVA